MLDLVPLRAHAANNYAPLPVVLTHGEGAWVTDVGGRRYLDALAGYSAVLYGHRHPVLIAAARAQLDRLTLTSRAFHHDRFAGFCDRLSALTGHDAVLPMNTGAEAVETALKLSRRWGYRVRGVPDGQATIVVAAGNFHGRTTTIVGFSTDPDARDGFGPFTPGFVVVPYGDADAVAAAIDDTTVAVLLEPVQGEAGVIVPPDGYLRQVRAATERAGVLLIADEVQSGLGRVGATFACEAAGVHPDVYVLGKALGGGIVPVSAVTADRAVMDVFTPGSHGSTFGGNPLGCAVGAAVCDLLADGGPQARARELGARLLVGLGTLPSGHVAAVRGIGLWAGVVPAGPAPDVTAAAVCHALLARGVLAKEAHGTVRLSPATVITEAEIDLLVDAVGAALAEVVG